MMTTTRSLSARVRKIVNREDPIGLIKIGCPDDEYDPEIKLIIPTLKTAKNPKDVQNAVHSIFVKMFDRSLAGPKRRYINLAEELYALVVMSRPKTKLSDFAGILTTREARLLKKEIREGRRLSRKRAKQRVENSVS